MNTSYMKVFGYSRKGKEEETGGIEGILLKVPIFEGLSRREIASVLRILHKRLYQPDEVIFRQDEPGMGMYIIEAGKVAIVSEPSNLVLSELADGDFFGEVALLDESPRSASAIAKAPCSVFGFFQPDLFGLLERDPRLGVRIVLRLARMIGARLRKANEQVLACSQEITRLKAEHKST
jgi:CRP-like cAMP-binding protein